MVAETDARMTQCNSLPSEQQSRLAEGEQPLLRIRIKWSHPVPFKWDSAEDFIECVRNALVAVAACGLLYRLL